MNFKKFIFLFCLLGCKQANYQSDPIAQFKPLSSGVLSIELTADINDSIFVEARALRIIPKQGSETETLAIDKAGTYYLTLPIDRPATATFEVNNTSYNIMISPGDTTLVKIIPEVNTNRLAFAGKHAAINDYYLAKKQKLGYTNILIPLNKQLASTTTYLSLSTKVDAVTQKEFQFLDSVRSLYNLPDWFYDYEMAEIKYAGIGFKTNMPAINRLCHMLKDSLPDNYFDFVNKSTIDDKSATRSTKYYMFLDSYFTRNLSYDQVNLLSGFDRIQAINNHILSTSRDVISSDIQAIYYKYLFSSAIRYLNDSTKIDSLAVIYGIDDYKDLISLKSTRTEQTFKVLYLENGDLIPEFQATDERDSLYSIRDFSNKIIYLNFWATWCGPCIQNMKNLNALISNSNNKDIYFINVCLDSEKDKWRIALKKHNIQGTNLYSTETESNQLKAIFNINGIPHYTLIGKNNILFENKTDKAPYVSEKINRLIASPL
jgi:thiol-disulfide isomerase/thioredoxin